MSCQFLIVYIYNLPIITEFNWNWKYQHEKTKVSQVSISKFQVWPGKNQQIWNHFLFLNMKYCLFYVELFEIWAIIDPSHSFPANCGFYIGCTAFYHQTFFFCFFVSLKDRKILLVNVYQACDMSICYLHFILDVSNSCYIENLYRYTSYSCWSILNYEMQL